ncbi:MAG: DUF58 domain-containing protein [Anaerolineales bacterium]|nr:DUF58 domain-containing protein [Anaerolineales bacterium]
MLIFDETTLRKLENLTLIADQVRVGVMKGNRRSSKRGSAIDFADYRDYAQGDDLRRLDWNVYARLERPFIKLFEAEEDLTVHLLVDSSASMDWPPESNDNKLHHALQLTGALGHIALATGDRVTVTLLNSQHERSWGPFRHQQNSLHLFRFLESATPGGLTDINLSLKNYALRARRPGLLLLFSDLLTQNGYKEGLNALQARGYEIGIIHILSPAETNPDMHGDLKLIDVESGLDAEITLDASTHAQYRANLANWQNEISQFCHKRSIHFIPVSTDESWEKLILQTFRGQGVVK